MHNPFSFSFSFPTPNPPKTQKRLLLAQHLRTKNRQQIIQQARTDMCIKQKIHTILHTPPINYQLLYSLMQSSKIVETNAAVVLAEWVQTNREGVREVFDFGSMNSRKQMFVWGYVLCVVVQGGGSGVEVGVGVVRGLVEGGEGLEIGVGVMAEILKAVNKSISHPNSNWKPTPEILLKIQQECEYIVQKGLQSPMVSQSILQLTHSYLHAFPNSSATLCSSPHFLKQLLKILEENLGNPASQITIIKILIFITYYDHDLYTGAISNLLEFGLLDGLRFLLQFTDHRHDGLKFAVLVVLDNVVKDGFVDQLIDAGFMGILLTIISQGQISKKTLMQAQLTYLSLIQHLPFHHSSVITSTDTIPRILQLLDEQGKYQPSILQGSFYAIANIMNIGQQMKEDGECQINPFMLRFRYQNAKTVFAKFQASLGVGLGFEGLVRMLDAELGLGGGD